MPRLLDLLYLSAWCAAIPWILWRRIRHGKHRRGWSQKLLGRLPRRTATAPAVWFHAVSVGEVLLLRPVIQELRTQRPDVDLVLTVTTETGHDVARATYPDLQVHFCPFDFTWATKRAIRTIRPSLLVLVELELWPNLLREATRQLIPWVIINGRMSEQSFRGYWRARFLFAPLFKHCALIASQNACYTERFRSFGVDSRRVVTTGSVKFDGVQTDRRNPRTAALRRVFQIQDHELVFIVGSTQAPEEQLALDTWRTLHSRFPQLRLILVPRHRERFDEVAQLVQSEGFPLMRRTECEHSSGDERPVLLLDTLGELTACWGLADIAFVGGSLSNRGGQNMIEPAAYGAAVLFGPNTRNFRDVVHVLLAGEAARVINNGHELTRAVCHLCENAVDRQAMGQRAADLVARERGATERTVKHLCRFLPEATSTLSAA